MGQPDWSALTGSAIVAPSVSVGVTSAIVKPNGGGNFVLVFNSREVVTGVAGLFANQAGFIDMEYGALFSFCVMRGQGAYTTGFAPFGFIGIETGDADDFGYLLGLANADPYHVVLRKGRLSDGLPDTAPVLNNGPQPDGTNMRRGTVPFSPMTWHQFLLGVAVNLNGDVVVTCKQNDLANHSCVSPVWEDIPGITQVTDDMAGIMTGSDPLIPPGTATAKAGLAQWCNGISRWSAFDQASLRKQLPL